MELCFYYTRAGVRLTPTTCSDAPFKGGWVAGSEKRYGATDSLGLNDPPTIFNYTKVLSDPSAHW